MKLWLTRCDGGRYLLTALKPKILPIRGKRTASGGLVYDAFDREGEPIAVRYLCEDGIRALFGEALPPLTPTKVEITAKFLRKYQETENKFLTDHDSSLEI